ncbi:hypothetical protein TSUD_323700 [Trifolium subterraneum]|uniref:Serine-threonine/tyrosine-protein kinase catalytic domain-containing protein n=1 Tax=Trifolium subterraneum TaxID=3900 RepID=A0A2Z6NSU2_TRISU|nr:hypothetical protein TSUD_323700 [Trifolium subterraneum]
MFRDRKSFPKLVDHRLQGHYTVSGLRMAIEMAAMCLREEPRYRPDASDIVLALDYLSSKQYVPKGSGTVSPVSMDIDDSPEETPMILPKDLLREQAVAEAKQWGETWRDKRRQSDQSPEDLRG